jgi:hypothetical protein
MHGSKLLHLPKAERRKIKKEGWDVVCVLGEGGRGWSRIQGLQKVWFSVQLWFIVWAELYFIQHTNTNRYFKTDSSFQGQVNVQN